MSRAVITWAKAEEGEVLEGEILTGKWGGTTSCGEWKVWRRKSMWSGWQHQPVAIERAVLRVVTYMPQLSARISVLRLLLQAWQWSCIGSGLRRTTMPRIGHEELKTVGVYTHQPHPPPTDTHSMYSHGKNSLCFKHSSSAVRYCWFGNRTLNFQDVNYIVRRTSSLEYHKSSRHV